MSAEPPASPEQALAAALTPKLARYLSVRLAGGGAVEISGLTRIHGGASRETYRFHASYSVDGQSHARDLILRRDPQASLIDTDRALEFHAYRAFHGTHVPAPEPVVLETDGGALERPFFIMEAVNGCTAASLLQGDPYGPHARTIGEQFWTILGRIAAADPRANGLAAVMPGTAAGTCALEQLAHWEAEIDVDEREPQPIARAAIRWLRRNPPPPAQKIAVVHGDYRSGNFLFDGTGTVRAVLDWEMSHLGDPLEDLAWALDPLWAVHLPDRPGGMIGRDSAIALWERASGLRADPAALAWWEVFAGLKGLAIWISAAREHHDGRNADAVNAFSGWFCHAFHNRRLAQLLSAKEAAS